MKFPTEKREKGREAEKGVKGGKIKLLLILLIIETKVIIVMNLLLYIVKEIYKRFNTKNPYF